MAKPNCLPLSLILGLTVLTAGPSLMASTSAPAGQALGGDADADDLPTPAAWMTHLVNHPNVHPLVAPMRDARATGTALGVGWSVQAQATPELNQARQAWQAASDAFRSALALQAWAEITDWNDEGQDQGETLALAVALQPLIIQFCLN